ncbi:hypothetical protein LTR94_030111, partial [Friedmanniomyces endolithicus]
AFARNGARDRLHARRRRAQRPCRKTHRRRHPRQGLGGLLATSPQTSPHSRPVRSGDQLHRPAWRHRPKPRADHCRPAQSRPWPAGSLGTWTGGGRCRPTGRPRRPDPSRSLCDRPAHPWGVLGNDGGARSQSAGERSGGRPDHDACGAGLSERL